MFRAAAALALLTLPAAAQSPVRASYAAYASGLNILTLEAGYHLGRDGYRVEIALRTAGLLSAFLRGEQTSLAEGRIAGGDVLRPQRYVMDGVWRGTPRRVAIDYDGATPQVRAVVPPNDAERDEVPEAMRAGTVDTLTALAILARRIDETGRCDGSVATFDGRRRVDFTATTVGTETLVSTGTAPFGGTALRCAFEGVQTAGFWRDQNREDAARPQRGTAWFARVVPDAAPIPVRIAAETRWFGTAFLYLLSAESGELPRRATTAGN